MKTTTIVREIMGNNTQITLTEQEMESIYEHVQLEYDKEEVKARLEESETEYNMDDIPEELIEKMAKEFRIRMDNIAETMGDGRIPAMENTFEVFNNELDKYVPKWKTFTKLVRMTVEHAYSIRARDEDEAENIFDAWSEHNARRMVDDLTDDAEYKGDFEYDDVEEDVLINPDCADIQEGN